MPNDPKLSVPADAVIVAELVNELMDISRVPPFKVGIPFDAKAGPCPRPIHNVEKKGTIGSITFSFQGDARRWLRDTLMAGHTALRAEGRDWPHERSVDQRRRLYQHRAERAALTPAERQAMDDEIPF